MVSLLEDEGVTNSRPSIESWKGFATSVMAPGIDVRIDSPLVGVALRSGLFATDDSVKAEQDCLLGELNNYKLENEQSETLILERIDAMKAMSTCLVDLRKRVVITETKEELLEKSNAKLLAPTR